MNPSVWPDWLDDVWAKSADKGEGGEPESLAQHTWSVLQRLSEFINLRPDLPTELGLPRLWHDLFWAAFLHDFGKAAGGFQARLRGGDRWPHRHEVLSLAFLDWLADGLSSDDQAWITAAIVSHHKEADAIQRGYPPPDEADLDEDDQLVECMAQFEEVNLRGLWRWLETCASAWAMDLGLDQLGVERLPIMPEQAAIPQIQQHGAKRIYDWLKVYRRFIRKVKKSKETGLIIGTLTLRGYLINADHSASAHAGYLPRVQIKAEAILQSGKLEPDHLFEHQRLAAEIVGSALLTAPTGSGKTEAALLWAARQAAAGKAISRLFYTLPYQASMNAMKLRLDKPFGSDLVGLQHGRGLLALYGLLLEDKQYTAKEADKEAKWGRNLAKLNYPPIRIFSPYQMLKGMYRLKGYEAILSDYHHALFVFDEIHAYEVKRLALILKTVEYLRKHYQAKFFVMSATFPTLIKEWLQEALDQPTEIEASPDLFADFKRHRLHLLDGDLLDPENLALIADAARSGQSVLVACNLVARAQDAYRYLVDALAQDTIQVELLHGRFNMAHRSTKEQLVRDYAGSKADNRKPIVLVATQVVEVSLDIDLDTIYSDPAPLEALVQRFGRINRRRRNKNLANVHVFRQPDDGQKIYDERLVKRTLDILSQMNQQPLNEGEVGAWLDEIYSGEVSTGWQKNYIETAKEFEAANLDTLRAFEASPELTLLFYKAFDGTEVLPKILQSEYDSLKERDPIRANEPLVPISYGRLHQLRQANRLMTESNQWPQIVDLPYDEEIGLDFSELTK